MELGVNETREDVYTKAFVVRLGSYSVLAGLALIATFVPQELRVILGILIASSSFVLVQITRAQLGKSFSVNPQAKALVTKGFYAHITHPLYLFVNTMFLGLIILFGLPLLLAAWVVFVLIQSLQARREERLLSTVFGAEYVAYRARTWF